jgi:hypothetical protein
MNGRLVVQEEETLKRLPAKGGQTPVNRFWKGLAMNDIFEIVFAFIIIFELAAIWTLFDKAGFPGWAAIVPFYNLYVLCKVADKSGWWVLLLFVPFLSIVFWILLYVAIAQNFNKGVGFMLGLIFFPFIFVPILAFGDAAYLTICGSQSDSVIDTVQFVQQQPAKSLSWRS